MVKSLEDILKVPFSERSEEEQKQIILAGKPRPVFESSKLGSKNKFDPACYDKELWLTACDKKCTFYCWSCLLFSRETQTIWNTEGFSDYDSLYHAMKKHNCSADHTKGLLKLMQFLHKNVAPLTLSGECENKTNDDFLERIVKFLCDLVLQISEPPDAETNFGDFITNCVIDSLNLFKNYDFHSCKETIDIINNSSTAANFVQTLSFMVKMVIKEEIRCSNHVSLIINEHSTDEKSAVVSLLFRFVKDGEVCERFVGFYCFNRDFITGVVKRISEILAEFDIGEKLLAFSVNGAWMKLLQLQSFITLMREEHGCFFTPCYFQNFGDVIERRVSSIEECNAFFKSLNFMRSYTKSSSKMHNVWNGFLKDHAIDLKFNQSNFNLIRILKEHKKQFVIFFQSITNNHEEWTDEEVLYAMELQRTLEDFQTIFLLETFFILSDLVVSIDNTLKSYNTEKIFENKQYANFQSVLCNMKKNDFKTVWDKSCSEKSDDAYASQHFTRFQLVFDEITDCIIGEVKFRIEPMKELNFFQLLNSKNPEELELSIEKVSRIDDMCDINALKNEMKEFKATPSYNAPVHEIIRFLIRNNLTDYYTNIYKLAEIILSMPVKPAVLDKNSSTEFSKVQESSVHGNIASTSGGRLSENPVITDESSKLELIKKWSTTFPAIGRISTDWSFLSIESGLLKSLTAREQFFVEFISLFKKENPGWYELLSQNNL